MPAHFELRCIVLHPPHDGGMRQRQAALGHHLHQILQAQLKPEIPAHAQQDDLTARRELFYWIAVLFTFALGTAAGDLATEALSLGFTIGVVVFGALIGLIAWAYYGGANAVLTFWLAYILTRPLGASFGDLLSQSQVYGGLGLGTTVTSLAFLAIIVTLVTYLSFDLKRSSVTVRI